MMFDNTKIIKPLIYGSAFLIALPLGVWISVFGNKAEQPMVSGDTKAVYSFLVLDLDGSGVETNALHHGARASRTYFDIDNDGFMERMGWPAGGDGLLALDRNRNGNIDNQSELFGNSAEHPDGFSALKALDGNDDNKITPKDMEWGNLRVWIDADNNGVTDSGELRSLDSLGITQMHFRSKQHSDVVNNENTIAASSVFLMNGLRLTLSDVRFRFDQLDTRITRSHTLNPKTLFLPTLRGFGNLKDLHLAMSSDPILLAMVENFVKDWSISKFSNTAALDAEIKAILFKWAGVEQVLPRSRGPYVDAHAISFMEKLTGQNWGGGATPRDPAGLNQGRETNESFEMVFSVLKTQLMIQAGAHSLFEQAPIYNYARGELTEGVISAKGIAALAEQAPPSTAPISEKQSYWAYMANVLISAKDYTAFTPSEKSGLDDAIGSSVDGLTFDSLVASLATYAAKFTGTEFSDYMVGTRGPDTLSGLDGDDIISGEEGDDQLQGGDKDDTYRYMAGDGLDTLVDTGGSDTLKIEGDYLASDVSYLREGNDLHIFLKGQKIVQVLSHFGDQNHRLEKITFDDGVSLEIEGIEISKKVM